MKEFFGGNCSSYRLVMIVSIFSFVLTWAGLSILKRELLEFPETVVYVFGILITGKVGQAYVEEKKEPKP